VVALVGYTNAGKSTLFNALTEAGVLESARMFASSTPNCGSCNFLPAASSYSLIRLASSATFPTHSLPASVPRLKRVERAEILLHIQDAASPVCEEQKAC
jgi:GTP-binding protein HflX